MPGEFHLSIKNAQRKIVDVRDLFKDLSETELKILEDAKLRSEEEKRLKTQLENASQFDSQHSFLEKKTLFRSQPNLHQKSSVHYESHKLNPLNISNKVHNKNKSMFFTPKSDQINNKKQFNRCISNLAINEIQNGSHLNNYGQYNIVYQKISVKKPPPKPKKLTVSFTSSNESNSSVNNSNTSSTVNNGKRTKVIRINSSAAPKAPPKPKITACYENNKKSFNSFKDKVKNFFDKNTVDEVDKRRFSKFRFSQVSLF